MYISISMLNLLKDWLNCLKLTRFTLIHTWIPFVTESFTNTVQKLISIKYQKVKALTSLKGIAVLKCTLVVFNFSSREMDTPGILTLLSRETTIVTCLLSCTSSPFWKGVYSNRKEFAPRRSKFFPFRVDSFQKEIKQFWLIFLTWKHIQFPLIWNVIVLLKCTLV